MLKVTLTFNYPNINRNYMCTVTQVELTLIDTVISGVIMSI